MSHPETSREPQSHSWLLGLLGEHIGGSLTPAMHEAEARRQALLLSYRTLDATKMGPLATGAAAGQTDWPRLVQLAGELTFDGVNVTHPAKQAVLPALDELSAEAELLGAVNTVLFRDGRAIGDNTDYAGFTDALRALGGASNAVGAEAAGAVDLSSVVQLGAGGAGSATAYALLREGAEHLTLVDVDRDRADGLVARLAQAFDASRMSVAVPDEAAGLVARASGLVNSTPIGMTGVSETSPIDVAALHPGLWVGDAVYRPLKTVLVRAAEALGCAAFGGAHMVVGQAAVAFELFTGLTADRAAMSNTFTSAALAQWGDTLVSGGDRWRSQCCGPVALQYGHTDSRIRHPLAAPER